MKKLLPIIFILLVAGNAWGADIYVNCDWAGAESGTSAEPYNQLSDITVSAGDNVYLKGGVTCAAADADTATAMLEITEAGVTVENWPTDNDCVITRSGNTATYGDGCAVLDGENSLPFGLYFVAATTPTFNDIVAINNTWNGIRVEQTGTADITVTSSRCGVVDIGPADDSDATYNVLWKGTGQIIGRGTMNYAAYSGTITDFFALNCGRAGADIRGKSSITYVRPKAFYCGLTEGAFGLMAHTTNTTYGSGWADQGGNIWSRSVVSAADDEQLIVNTSAAPSVKYYRGADDDTTPDAGEFSIVSNTTIYVNFGATDPNTVSVRIIRQPCDITYTSPEVAYTNDQDTFHGAGIAADDYTTAVITNARVYENEGDGVLFASSKDGSISFSEITDNLKRGIYVSGGDSIEVLNNTVVDNGTEQIGVAGEMRTGLVENNLTYGGTYGIRYQHDALTDVTDTDNSNLGYGASTTNCVGPTCLEINPRLTSANVPMEKLVANGGTFGPWLDSTSGLTSYGSDPPIGAKEWSEEQFIPRIGPPFRTAGFGWDYYTILYDLFVSLALTEDLSDSQEELADGTFARASASTYVDPDDGLLKMAHATRPQSIEDDPDFSMQNPTSADSWWTKTNCTVNDSGGIITTDTSSTIHYIYANDLWSLGSVPLVSLKIKAGETSWIRLAFRDDDDTLYAYFDIGNGIVGTVDSGLDASMSGPDDDGYYRCWMWKHSINATTYARLFIYPAEADGDATYSGHATNPEIYIKEIMLEEVPSDLALGPELVTNGDNEAAAVTSTELRVTTSQSSEQANGGTYSQKVVFTDGNSSHYVIHSAIPAGWYKISADFYIPSGQTLNNIRFFDATDGIWVAPFIVGTDTWVNSTVYVYKATAWSPGWGRPYAQDADGDYFYVDNVSIKEIPAATMYNALGPELVTNGDFSLWSSDDPSSWTVLNEDASNYITEHANGARMVSDDTAAVVINQVITVVPNSYYKLFTTISNYSAGDVRLRINDVTNSSPILDYTNMGWTADGTYTYIFKAPAGCVEINLYYVRDSTGATDLVYAESSLKEIGQFISPSDYINASSIPAEPRFEEDGLAFLGGSVLNLIPYSEDFSEWSNSNSSDTFGVKGPTGENTATALVEDGTEGQHNVYYSVPGTKDDTVYTISVFVKRGSGTRHLDIFANTRENIWPRSTFNLATNTPGVSTLFISSGMEQVGDYWRCWARANFGTGATVPRVFIGIDDETATVDMTYTGDSTSSLYIFGANLTETNYLAPYIPSNGAPTAIAAESLSFTLTAGLKNILSDAEGDATSEGTLVVEWTPGIDETVISGDHGIISFALGTQYNLSYFNATNFNTYDGTSPASGASNPAYSAGDPLKLACIFTKSGNELTSGVKFGGSWTFDATPSVYDGAFAVGTTMILGVNNLYPFHIKNLRFYRRALSTDVIEENF